jgi:SET domain
VHGFNLQGSALSLIFFIMNIDIKHILRYLSVIILTTFDMSYFGSSLTIPVSITTHKHLHVSYGKAGGAIARQSNSLIEQRNLSYARRVSQSVALHAVKKTKKQTVNAAGLKGFGAVVTTSTTSTSNENGSALQIDIDRSRPTLSFYESSLQQSSIASENFKRTALAYTYSGVIQPDTYKLRGVVTTRDVPKGNDLISIPYEMAVDLGPEGNDPTIPALLFLKDYCSVLSSGNAINDDFTKRKLHYYRMLPAYDSPDCRGCTNFFTEEALHALQCPYIIHETNQCKLQIRERYEQEVLLQQQKDQESGSIDPSFLWTDGVTPLSIEHLTWAVWIITSRVLTVQTGTNNDDDVGPVQYRRLLIPYLDMCNHDRTSNHVLTGRATRGGLLRIVAGSNMKTGTPIEICYGGGQSGNDRFLQEYGFLDTNSDAYRMVAMDLLGQKRRGSSDSGYRSLQDRTDCIQALRTTTVFEDEKLLLSLQSNDDTNANSETNMKVAIQYRIGVKKALQELNGEQW